MVSQDQTIGVPASTLTIASDKKSTKNRMVYNNTSNRAMTKSSNSQAINYVSAQQLQIANKLNQTMLDNP